MSHHDSVGKRNNSRSGHHRRHHHRHRRSRLNADLYDEEDDDKRDAWADGALSPDSLWKELQFQRYLKDKMRRSLQAKARMVDGQGRLVTLAERIIRFKLYETDLENENMNQEEPSTSGALSSSVEEKKDKLANLLHQYIKQRHSESAITSELLEEISDAKTVLYKNEYRRALSAKKEISCTSSLSLGDSATNYNIKTVTRQRTLENAQKEEERMQDLKLDVHCGGEKTCEVDAAVTNHDDECQTGADDKDTPANLNTEIAASENKEGYNLLERCADTNIKTSLETNLGNKIEDSGISDVKFRNDLLNDNDNISLPNDLCISYTQEKNENTPLDGSKNKERYRSESVCLGDGSFTAKKECFQLRSGSVRLSDEANNHNQAMFNPKATAATQDDRTSSVSEHEEVAESKPGVAATRPKPKESSGARDADRVGGNVSGQDRKDSETDSAIESFDIHDLTGSTDCSGSLDVFMNRAYQFTGFSLNRSYTLPELLPADSFGIFAAQNGLGNRKRGQSVTLISSSKGSSTNNITSHLLPGVSSSSYLPLPPIRTKQEVISHSSRLTTPENTAPANSEADKMDSPNCSEKSNADRVDEKAVDESFESSKLSVVGKEGNQLYDEEFIECCSNEKGDDEISDNSKLPADSHFPSISNTADIQCEEDVETRHTFYPEHANKSSIMTTGDIDDREKRVIGLYNELKVHSMFQKSHPSVAIAMTSKPNGSTNLRIEWGAFDSTPPLIADRKVSPLRQHPKLPEMSSRTEFSPRESSSNQSVSIPNENSCPDTELRTHNKPPEFIYLRDLSFSHYVKKVVSENRLSRYFEHQAFRNSKVSRRGLCPEVLLQGWKRKETNGYKTGGSGSDRDGVHLKLPTIDPNQPVSLVKSKSQKFPNPAQIKGGHSLNVNCRGKLAFDRLKKKLKLPKIDP